MISRHGPVKGGGVPTAYQQHKCTEIAVHCGMLRQWVGTALGRGRAWGIGALVIFGHVTYPPTNGLKHGRGTATFPGDRWCLAPSFFLFAVQCLVHFGALHFPRMLRPLPPSPLPPPLPAPQHPTPRHTTPRHMCTKRNENDFFKADAPSETDPQKVCLSASLMRLTVLPRGRPGQCCRQNPGQSPSQNMGHRFPPFRRTVFHFRRICPPPPLCYAWQCTTVISALNMRIPQTRPTFSCGQLVGVQCPRLYFGAGPRRFRSGSY